MVPLVVNERLQDSFLHAIAIAGAGDRALALLKVIAGIAIIIVVGGAVCFGVAVLAALGPVIMIGSAIAIIVGFIIGAYVVCLGAAIAFIVSLILWAFAHAN